MQQPDSYHYRILKLVPECDKYVNVREDYAKNNNTKMGSMSYV